MNEEKIVHAVERFVKSKKVITILWIGVGMVIGFLLMKYVLQEFPNPFNNP